MTHKLFYETYEILFGEPETINSGTSKIMSNQRKIILKKKATGELINTAIYSSSEELGELMVLEKYCSQ
ncbi:hypothetical protein [Ferruginibacter sp.]|uniref:hypothetical protein n=1 Tax=Ferruginibacter sp. TaxID=1940288 RepID=UPI0019AD3FEF|nr:hypothetical protein [Ferruginibacter sp.]MBC7629317.1 hypothetical protein [Ferruginibacter sp.]